MMWSLIIVGAAGFLLGLTLRVGALIAATVLTIAFGMAFRPGESVSVAGILWFIVELVVLLEVTYVIGLALRVLWRRPGNQ